MTQSESKQIFDTHVKMAKITSGTKEWADHNVNCIKGCHNDCRYCYAKMMAKRFGRATEESWHIMSVKTDAVKKNYHKMSGRVMFPSTHDIFEYPEFEKACFIVLTKLLESGNEVLVTSKPRINAIRKIHQRFSKYKKQIQFRFTITSHQDYLLRFWEPNAPCFKERINSLIFAFKENYKTSVSIEPFLDYDPTKLVKIVEPYITESIWIGRMNYIPKTNISEKDKTHYEEIRKNYEEGNLWKIYHKFENHLLIRFKDSIRIQLGLEDQDQ